MEECQEELEDHIRDVSLVYEDWEEIERGLYVRLQRLVADLLAYTHTLPRNRLHQVSEQRQRFRHYRLGCKQISEQHQRFRHHRLGCKQISESTLFVTAGKTVLLPGDL